MICLYLFKSFCSVRNSFFPGYFLPRIINAVSNHWYRNSIFVGSITEGKTTLHTGVSFIGLTVLIRSHAYHFIPFHLGLEGTANSTVGAGSDNRMLGFTSINDTFFCQSCCRARINTSSTRDTVRIHKGFILSCTHLRLKASAVNSQSEGTLRFLTGSYTTRTNNTFRGVEGEIGIRLILFSN